MSLFGTRKHETPDQRYAASIAAFDDARGVVRYGLSARQYQRQRFLVRARDAGLDPLKVAFAVWLIGKERLGSDDLEATP